MGDKQRGQDEGSVMYLSFRTLETFVKTASKQFPVLLVTGARQVGKRSSTGLSGAALFRRLP